MNAHHHNSHDRVPEQKVWEQAYEWVDNLKNKKKIMNYATKFRRFSPYGKEDYLQQAYISAFFAFKEFYKKGGEFEAVFWTTLKKHFSGMATNPAKKDILGENTNDKSPCNFEEYEQCEEQLIKSQPCTISEEDSLNDFAPSYNITAVNKALYIMTPNERLVWNYLLGFSDGIYTPGEIACINGVSRQNIEKLRDSGLHRVFEHYGQQAHL